jgi:hypothetical protein
MEDLFKRKKPLELMLCGWVIPRYWHHIDHKSPLECNCESNWDFSLFAAIVYLLLTNKRELKLQLSNNKVSFEEWQKIEDLKRFANTDSCRHCYTWLPFEAIGSNWWWDTNRKKSITIIAWLREAKNDNLRVSQLFKIFYSEWIKEHWVFRSVIMSCFITEMNLL